MLNLHFFSVARHKQRKHPTALCQRCLNKNLNASSMCGNNDKSESFEQYNVADDCGIKLWFQKIQLEIESLVTIHHIQKLMADGGHSSCSLLNENLLRAYFNYTLLHHEHEGCWDLTIKEKLWSQILIDIFVEKSVKIM